MAPRKTPPADAPLSDDDREALAHAREQLREREHWRWLWSLIGRVIKWALACMAGLTVLHEFVLRVWRAIHGP